MVGSTIEAVVTVGKCCVVHFGGSSSSSSSFSNMATIRQIDYGRAEKELVIIGTAGEERKKRKSALPGGG